MSKKKKAEEKDKYQPPRAEELTHQDLVHVVGGAEPSEHEPFLPYCASGSEGY